MNSDYHVSKPYDRAIWKGGEIIGTVCLSRTDADAANKLSGAVFYIGFTEEERILLRNGTFEELKKAGFLD